MPDDTPFLDLLAESRVLPVVVLEDAGRALDLGAALVAGGARCAEVTFRTAAAVATIRALVASTGLCVGAGTVVRPDQVDAAAEAGARFIVSPGLSPAVVARSRHHGLPVLPGVATPTDIMAALELGLDVLKFFPAGQLGGPATLRALAGPFTSVRFVPTGGITADLLERYLAEPSVLAVGGSWMVEPRLIAAGDWAEITARTADTVRRIGGPADA